MYTTRATAWPRITAGKERFGLVLPRLGLGGPEAGPVGWPPEATVQVSKGNDEAVTGGSGPGSCHSLRPAPPPCVCPPSSPESPADVSHQSQPQTPLQTQREAPFQRATVSRTPRVPHPGAAAESSPAGPGKRCARAVCRGACQPVGSPWIFVVQPPPALMLACALQPSIPQTTGFGGGGGSF